MHCPSPRSNLKSLMNTTGVGTLPMGFIKSRLSEYYRVAARFMYGGSFSVSRKRDEPFPVNKRGPIGVNVKKEVHDQ